MLPLAPEGRSSLLATAAAAAVAPFHAGPLIAAPSRLLGRERDHPAPVLQPGDWGCCHVRLGGDVIAGRIHR